MCLLEARQDYFTAFDKFRLSGEIAEHIVLTIAGKESLLPAKVKIVQHQKRIIMEKLQEYFKNTKGIGVLATADSDGKVDAAIYSTPHFLEEGTLAFIMRDRLTHHNLKSNSSATFLFIEEGAAYKGRRLFLKKVREDNNSELINKIKRRKYTDDNQEPRYLVYFSLEKELPLIGDSF